MKYAQMSEVGNVRKINQDAVYAVERNGTGLFVIADGMGGYTQGEKASRLIVEKLMEWWRCFETDTYENDFKRMIHSLQQALEQANIEIYRQYNKGTICGSTVVALLVHQAYYGILYAGDSRAYLYEKHKIKQLTIDEIWENQADLKEQDRKKNWDKCNGKLLNAIGVRPEMQCRIITDQARQGMVFLLCSDGLYKYFPTRKLKKYMRSVQKGKNVSDCCESLMQKTLDGEAKDNVSIIMVLLGDNE